MRLFISILMAICSAGMMWMSVRMYQASLQYNDVLPVAFAICFLGGAITFGFEAYENYKK